MKNLKEFGSVNTQPIQESAQDEKTEKIQVLLSKEDLTDLGRKISKEALAKGEAPVSISHYVRILIRRDLGKTTSD
jgi:hypothetical protein